MLLQPQVAIKPMIEACFNNGTQGAVALPHMATHQRAASGIGVDVPVSFDGCTNGIACGGFATMPDAATNGEARSVERVSEQACADPKCQVLDTG